MNEPTSLPLRFVHNLAEGNFLIDEIQSPKTSLLGNGWETVEGSAEIPSTGSLNLLLKERKVAEFFHCLASLPQGFRVLIEVPKEHNIPFHPSGRYAFIVGGPKGWKYQLLVISQSEEFRRQIAANPEAILSVAREVQFPKSDEWLAPSPSPFPLTQEEAIKPNAALVALAYQFSAYGAAHILHPIMPKWVGFSTTGEQNTQIPTDSSSNNLWWFIAQRRALDYEFSEAVGNISIDIYSATPVLEQVNGNVCIEYPPASLQRSPAGSKIESLEQKLCDVAKQYHRQIAKGIALNTPYSSELLKMFRKKERLQRQLRREREGLGPETWRERINRWFSQV